jgi:hypothetical protein
MAAQTSERRIREERWSYQTFTLGTNKTAYKGAIAVFDQSAGVVIPAEEQTDLAPIGVFDETVTTTGSTKPVVVKLFREVVVRWFKNDGTNPVTVNDLGKNVYMVDDQTVSILSTGRSVLGQAWAVSATLGVAVEVK